MKRNYVRLAAVAAITAVVSTTTPLVPSAQAQTSQGGFAGWWNGVKERRAAAKKQARTEKSAAKRAKELSKQGWTLMGSTRTLEEAILLHWDKVKERDGEEAFGTANNCAIPANCRTAAFADAALNYARMAGSELQEVINGDGQLNQAEENNASEFNKLYNAYESKAQISIKGELGSTPSLTLHNAKAKKMLVFFVVSPSAASKARIAALEMSLKESEIAQQYAKKISEHVKKAFADKSKQPADEKPSALDAETPAPAIAETE